MSGSDWLRYLAAVVIPIFVMIGLSTLTTWVVKGSLFGCHDTQEYAANGTQQSAHGYSLRPSVNTAYEEPNCQYPKNEDQDDVCQQRRMADAAARSTCFIAWQTGIALAGLMAVLGTVFFAWRAANAALEMNRITVKAHSSQQRPWITIAEAQFRQIWQIQYANPERAPREFTERSGFVGCTLINSGSQPAQNVRCIAACVDRFVAVDETLPMQKVLGVTFVTEGGQSLAEIGANNFIEDEESRIGLHFAPQIFIAPGQKHEFTESSNLCRFRTPTQGNVRHSDKRAVVIIVTYTGADTSTVFETHGVYEIVAIVPGQPIRGDLHPEATKHDRFGLHQIGGALTKHEPDDQPA